MLGLLVSTATRAKCPGGFFLTAGGYPEARFHDLCHSYAVAALQSGGDIKTVQENLGHHTAAFTLDIYGHVTDRLRRENAQRMQAYINSLQSPA